MLNAPFLWLRRPFVVLVIAITVETSGCAPASPVVANPLEPWEGEVVHEKEVAREAEASKPRPSRAHNRYGADDEEKKREQHAPLVVAITDIIAFPFRGAGWLARQVF